MSHAEILTDAGNWSIVQLPGRRYPGVVVQGDSLSILVAGLRATRDALQAGDVTTTRDEVLVALERLEQVKANYERVLGERSIPLPYTQG